MVIGRKFCIKKLKNNKTSGEDHIINEYIKSTSGLFLPIYEKIFNLIFETGFLQYDFLSPNWFSSNKKNSSENTSSLSFKIAISGLPRELRIVIGRKFLGSKGFPLFLYIGLILPCL
jgi:hypothetical protein